MNLSKPFVNRPIATVLLTLGLALAGIGAFFVLPVSPLPQVDFPAISVTANLPGGSPDTMATSVATPLERRLAVIAGVNEITSQSGNGQTRINLQFDLNRQIDAAAREVQAAINASRADLPSTLRQNPTYRKANPSDAPVIILALTSKTRSPGQIYDEVSNLVQQKLAQVKGVGDVEIGGGSLPAVRVDLIPYQMNNYGVSAEDIRAAIQATNPNRPKGELEGQGQRLQIYSQVNTPTQGRTAADYKGLVVAWRNGAAVRLQDIAEVSDGVEDIHTLGLFNGRPAIIVLVTSQPGANVIETVDGVRALLPQLQAQLPSDVTMRVASDRTNSIRASLREIEFTLMISIALVVLVVSVFLRSVRATVVPAVATVVSLLGTFGVMYLLGFSLNNLSLMALTVATGFVVDDAIVVLENTSRHVEEGMDKVKAALLGAQEVGFTVLSISLSLIAVFIPLLFMGGQVGRLFREFAVTLSVAVMISLVISLTTTPMLCALLLKGDKEDQKKQLKREPSRIGRIFERGFGAVMKSYEHALDWALDSKPLVMLILLFVVGLNVYLFAAAPKGFFPQQDTGQIAGGMRADQSISFQAMQGKLTQLVNTITKDPAVDTVVGFTGGSRAGGGFMFVNLKPVGERAKGESGQAVIARLRPKLAHITGVQLFLNPVQDLRMGGRQSNSTYQYTLKSDSSTDLKKWATRLADAMKAQKGLTDVDTDQADNGVETYVNIDTATAARLGISARDVDNAMYDAFGQRQVANIYDELNQYHVIMGVAQRYAQSPNALSDVYVPVSSAGAPGTTGTTSGTASATQGSTGTATATATGTGSVTSTVSTSSTTTSSSTGSAAPATQNAGGAGAGNGSAVGTLGAGTASSGGGGSPGSTTNLTAARDPSSGSALSTSAKTMVPLTVLARFAERSTPSSVNHQDGVLATTISFNLAPGVSLSQAQEQVRAAEAQIGMPTNVRGSFEGQAKQAQESNQQQPLLILAAIVVIYIVLGILYESLVHPLTVLSTLPSAGVGAVLALLMFHMEFSIIALIGIFLLIGIVKKNAILIIDFALDAERARGLSATEAVREACLLRFRPILMTTLAAALGALPLAIGFGEGSELRQPLGIAIIGGLIASQLLTLLTTPVVYVYLDKLRTKKPDEHELARQPVEHPSSVPSHS
jgi:multidrug efflux pump